VPLKTPPVQYDLIRLAGGLDQVTPTLSLPPGYVRRAANFECSITGGYSRIAGYERYDGRPSPSDATYNLLACTLTGSVAVGNTITGQSSAATAKVIAISGTNVIVTREVGVLLTGEGIRVGGTPVGTINEVVGVSSDGLLDATYKALAADDYRADIQAVPGSGSILGVAFYNGIVYAWRANAGATAVDMYRSSSSGWVKINFQKELPFNAGTSAITVGQTVTGATSGATGVVSRVVIEDGFWSGSDAQGRLILSSSTGTFQNAENLQVGGVTRAIGAGAATQISLAVGGRFETVIANFGGGTANYRLYGCDGVNRAFEFDGTVFVPINSTMPVDTPKHIAFHKQHLFLSFGASLQFSALGDPHKWSPILGAGELAMNAEITNLIPLPGDQSSGALGVYTRNDTSVLYGTSAANFALATFNTGTGAIPYTAQNMDQAYVLDDRGVMTLGTTLNFGNFLPASLTMNIRPFLEVRKNLATASAVSRDKGQYRVFFSDANALYLTMLNGKLLGSMPVQFAHPVTCATEGEDTNGNATTFFGSSNGYVYQLDVGTSFDGQPIPANINLVYNSTKSPRVLKRYRKASVEMTGDSYAEIAFGYDLAYRKTSLTQPTDETYENDLRSAYWDSMTWDNFVWDGSDITPSEIEVEGTAENMAIRISSVSAILQPFTVNNIIVHLTVRRGLR
jgi:hypothetical protein